MTRKNHHYQEAIRLLTQAYHELAAAHEPALVLKVGALRGQVRTASRDAVRDEEFHQPTQEEM